MADLPEAINPERKAEIDTVGWLTGSHPYLPASPCWRTWQGLRDDES